MSEHAPGDLPSTWEKLPTEARHSGSLELDRLDSRRIVELLLTEDRRGIEAAAEHAGAIARVAEWTAETLAGGRRLLLVGAGTSGRLGVLEAAECPPTFGTDPSQIRALMAGGDEAVFSAREGAEDQADDGRRAVRDLGDGDLVVAISASSVTPFARGALEGARAGGARTVLLTCASSSALEGVADLVLALDTGPEILTGSTRLKAGSATKAVLNAITTTAMVRLGKTFENLMVDVRPGSAKLRDRARRILRQATGLAAGDADRFYEESGGELKTAIVMARRGVGAERARALLADAGGHVRDALEDVEPTR